MTTPARLPTAQSEVADLKRRIYNLERKTGLSGSDVRPDLGPEFVVFNHTGTLTAAVSDPYVPLRRSRLSFGAFVLATAGSTSSVVTVYKNAVSIGTVTLASSDTYEPRTFSTTFNVGVDKLTVAATTQGTGAAGLVAEFVFV